MAEHTARDLMSRHNITAEDIRERKASLHHLRHIVRSENLSFDVFRELAKHRR